MKSVLVVVAHPDDAEISMGMRIHWYTQRGVRVRVHCLSTGKPEEEGSVTRRNECLSAGAVLMVDQYTFSDVPDTRFVEHRGRINSELFRVIGESRPDLVYTHYPDDQHIDHSITGQEVTAVAMREAMGLNYFRSPYSTGFEPNMFFVGTEKLMDAKVKALECFASQRQLDMDVFRQLGAVAYRQHVHHRVVERFGDDSAYCEMFRVQRSIEFGSGA
ncbi:PIG-L family deacetylase [Streptomyces avidinii]|uniref:PIG-L deacetylase family protein n=1 Tax=Streptomyces avidinii TaxID=1895 RepID=UPI00386F3706|nr:PIG-L family deacetylase [Streptomyces avidinii]